MKESGEMTMKAVIEKSDVTENGSKFVLTSGEIGCVATLPPAGRHTGFIKKNATEGQKVYVEMSTDLFDGLVIKRMDFLTEEFSSAQKKAIEICKNCKKFNGLKNDGTPKACKLKRTFGVILCGNRAAATGRY